MGGEQGGRAGAEAPGGLLSGSHGAQQRALSQGLPVPPKDLATEDWGWD